MPLDQGAPAPSSRHAERLARLKILRRRANSEQRKQRRFSKARLQLAEYLLRDIVDGADLVGEGVINNRQWYSPSGVYLLVGLTWHSFDRLCAMGADLEDHEDTGDAEPTEADTGEQALGWGAGHVQASGGTGGTADEDEFSLASLGMTDQRRWTEGKGCDYELDKADAEPSLGSLGKTDQTEWAKGNTRDLEPSGGAA